MNGALLGQYQPRDTWLHRRAAGHKLLGFMVVAIVVVALPGPWTGVGFLVAAFGLMGWSRAGWRVTLGALRGILVVAVLLAAWQAWQYGWSRAIAAVADLLGLILCATVLTVTTSIDELLDTLTRALGPFRRWLDPERVALTFSLMIRAIPTTITIADETRDAALARGLQRSPRARLVPVVIRVVAHARATGEALEARGVGDD